MNDEKKIFDLNKLDDLDQNVIEELKLNFISEKDKQILSLFDIKEILCIDEIIIGIARKYNTTIKRYWLINRMYALAKRNFVIRIENKRGLYKKANRA